MLQPAGKGNHMARVAVNGWPVEALEAHAATVVLRAVVERDGEAEERVVHVRLQLALPGSVGWPAVVAHHDGVLHTKLAGFDLAEGAMAREERREQRKEARVHRSVAAMSSAQVSAAKSGASLACTSAVSVKFVGIAPVMKPVSNDSKSTSAMDTSKGSAAASKARCKLSSAAKSSCPGRQSIAAR